MSTSLSWASPRAAARLKTPDAATLVTVAAFVVLFYQPALTLVRDWWTDPEAGHGLLLGPLAIWLAFRSWSPAEAGQARPLVGAVILTGSVLLRFLSGLAAELFTMRLSMVGALLGLAIYFGGFQLVRRWWLPFLLFTLAIPLPALVINSLALPLQLRASAMGAWLLKTRHVPVQLSGNILLLPDHRLFVTEACSGLRSLTALISLAVLAGGLWLNRPASRVTIVLLAIPIAMALNAVRIFLTGFMVFYVDKAMGDGFMHATEGWLMFVVAFICLGGVTWAVARVERSRERVPVAE